MQNPENIPSVLAPLPLPKAKRPRLGGAGATILQEFWTNHPSIFPSTAQQRELLERIHAIPGCEDFSLQNLKAWFQRRRKSSGTIEPNHQQKSIEQSAEPITTTLYPSLTDKSIQKLKILSQGNLSPSLEVIQTWAELLDAQGQDVVTWLFDQRHHEFRSHHLPTPTSTSPEPSNEYQEPLKFESPYSPILASLPPRLNLLASQQYHHPNPPTSTVLLKAIADADTMPIPPSRPPYTANEFEELFHPYMNKMQTIIHKLSSQCLPNQSPNT